MDERLRERERVSESNEACEIIALKMYKTMINSNDAIVILEKASMYKYVSSGSTTNEETNVSV